MRISLGYDRHRLVPDASGMVKVAGESVCCGFAVVAHSDGDVVFHAVSDALASVFLNRTIGELFPDDDEQWRDRDSSYFLERTYSLCGCPPIESADVVVVSDQVMLRGRTEAMRSNIARILGLETGRISMKGRRKEDDGVSPAIECFCTILFA